VGAFNNIFREAKAIPPFPFLFFLFPSHCGLPLTPRGTVPARARRAVSSPSIPCFIVCNITQCLLLQLIILFRSYSRRSGDDEMYQVPHARSLGPMSTSTPSFQQLYACGTLYLHLFSVALGLQRGVNSISLQCIPWPVACSEWGACVTDFQFQILGANDPESKNFENVFQDSATGHQHTFSDQIWWKSAVVKYIIESQFHDNNRRHCKNR